MSSRCLSIISSQSERCLSYFRMSRSRFRTSCSLSNASRCISTLAISSSCTLQRRAKISASSSVLILLGSSWKKAILFRKSDQKLDDEKYYIFQFALFLLAVLQVLLQVIFDVGVSLLLTLDQKELIPGLPHFFGLLLFLFFFFFGLGGCLCCCCCSLFSLLLLVFWKIP